MPTSGSITSFGQSLPIYADKSFIANSFTYSTYKTLTEDVVGAGKIYLATINGVGSDDVRLSKRKGLSNRRLRGFERNKVGPVDGKDHVGGNYAAALNFETNLPNLLPESSNTDVSLFLDFGNVWGVDYDSSIDDSNKIRSSTGVMASWMSPIGPMTFILSQNLSKADTDETESFNFQLEQHFKMKNLKNFIYNGLFIFTQNNTFADTPYFLDFKSILNESDAGKKAQSFLKNKLEKGIKDLKSKETKIQEEEKKIIQQKKVISAEEYKKKVTDLRSKVSALQKERNSLLESVAKQRTKARNELLRNLNPIIKDYMKEKKIRMVVDKKSLLLADENLNITKDIMSLLNKKLKSIKLN